jgi:predicted Zn-dependent protease with MMP-like domain
MNEELERGFEALEEGRIDDAASALERCRRVDRKNPDVVTLAAALADARGDTDDALAQYRTLSELQPDDPMPRICIARLQLKNVGDPDAALATLAAVFDFIDEEADLIEAIYVKTEALLARGEPKAAREALAELATSVIEDPELALDLGELALSAEDPKSALKWVETARAANRDSDLPKDEKDAFESDALHVLGRVHEATEDVAGMVAAWQQVRTLDMAAGQAPITVTEDEVEQIARETLAELPEEIRARLENVPIMIEDFPSAALVDDGFDPRALGLFQGNAMPDEAAALPAVTTILLFRKNLERAATDEDHLAEEIRITVLHETAHYFGLDEEDLEKLGLD